MPERLTAVSGGRVITPAEGRSLNRDLARLEQRWPNGPVGHDAGAALRWMLRDFAAENLSWRDKAAHLRGTSIVLDRSQAEALDAYIDALEAGP